jgi:Rha family phage regulatory protein
MAGTLFGRGHPYNDLSPDEIQKRALDMVMKYHEAGNEDWIHQVNHNWAFGWNLVIYWHYRNRLLRHGIEVTREYLDEMLGGLMVGEYLLPISSQFKKKPEPVLKPVPALPPECMECVAKFEDSLGLKVENGKIVVSSPDVAEAFGKEHKNVLRDIQNLGCSEEFHRLNFERMMKSVAIGKGATRESLTYNMTRDGFVFLVMKYEGPKAAMFKEAYIKRFNEMEEALRQEQGKKALPIPDQRPQKLYTPEEAADELFISGYKNFYALMTKLGLFVRVKGEKKMYRPRPEYVRQGLFVVMTSKHHYKRPGVTQAGIEFLRKKISRMKLTA